MNASEKYTGETIGKCPVRGCTHTVKKLSQTHINWNGDRCPQHPRYPLIWRGIKGTLNVNYKCDARCTHARGHNCECACGGYNHGNAYISQ